MSRRPEHLAPPEVVRVKTDHFLVFSFSIVSFSLQFYDESEARKYTQRYAFSFLISLVCNQEFTTN